MTGHLGATKVDLWQGRQQDLFRKYAKKRDAAMKAIKDALLEFKGDLE